MRNIWFQVAFAISLAFNVGLVVFQMNRPPAWHPHTPEEFLARISGKMPSSDFEKVKTVMDRSVPDIVQKRAASEHAMQQVASALRAEPFDTENLKSALDLARAAHADTEQSFQNVILQAAPTLSHDGRVTLAPQQHSEPALSRH